MIVVYLFFGVMAVLWSVLPLWSFLEVRRPKLYYLTDKMFASLWTREQYLFWKEARNKQRRRYGGWEFIRGYSNKKM